MKAIALVPGTTNVSLRDVAEPKVSAPDDVKISIKNPSSKKLSVQLMNALGQIVVIKNILTPGRDELINISLRHLPQGIYWLKVGNEGNIEMIKKIVHRR